MDEAGHLKIVMQVDHDEY